jgi:carboxyl-terminal processing protease
VGETTFGKGLVQNVYPLSAGAGLALTTAYYYTPSGRSIQKPLAEAQIVSDSAESRKDFRTDSGRPVRGGGGVRPDFEAAPEPLTRFRMVLEASGAFTQFATDYVRRHPGIAADFEVTAAALDEFQLYLSVHNIRPAVAEWSSERDWIAIHLKSEIFDQTLGVERGDEVEAQRDPVILTALARLGTSLRPGGQASGLSATSN